MSVAEDIQQALQYRGGQTLDELASSTGHQKKSLSSRLYDLKRWGQVVQDQNKSYWLAGQQEAEAHGNGVASAPSQSTGLATGRERQSPISADEEEFQKLLADCDVRRARNTITRTFFGADVYDLNNLVEVLEDARAYVNPNQARLVLRYWTRYIGADLRHLAKLEERLGRPTLNNGTSQGSDDDYFIQELGWTVAKDKDGDWVPQLGGELSHKEALRWAATMNATRVRGDDDDESDDDDAPRRRRRSGGARENETTILDALKTYKELFMPDTSHKDEEVRLLKESLE